MRGGALPPGSRVVQLGIHGEEMVVIVPSRPDGAEVDSAWLKKVANDVELGIRKSFEREEFETIVPRLVPIVGFAVLTESPFFRFERLVYRAVDEARAQARRREERSRRSWGTEVRQVIREEAIVVHFQPVVDLETLDVIGYEALSRGPAGSGLESPAVLFAHSREAGLSAELDRLCRRVALAALRGLGANRRIFLNTQADHLADPEWQDGHLEARLAEAGLGAGDLVVEFPQTGAIADESALERWVAELKRRGFRVAIDDIGTGYAGIQAFERLRPDYLKVDISLVRNIESNLIQQEILGSLVSIGRRLGASVVAEGIETEQELDYLKSHGARFGQGFLFSGATAAIITGPIVLGRDH